jgi:hypothetical protein
VKSWIRIRIKNKIQELEGHNMEPWRAVYAHNGGVEASNELWRDCSPSIAVSHHFNEKLDPGSALSDADPQPWFSQLNDQIFQHCLAGKDEMTTCLLVSPFD